LVGALVGFQQDLLRRAAEEDYREAYAAYQNSGNQSDVQRYDYLKLWDNINLHYNYRNGAFLGAGLFWAAGIIDAALGFPDRNLKLALNYDPGSHTTLVGYNIPVKRKAGDR
jgi:hypothetical protein